MKTRNRKKKNHVNGPELSRRGGTTEIIHLGFGNAVMASRIISIVSPKSLPMKRLRDEARNAGKLVDATAGRQTRSILVMDSGHIVLSSVQPMTLIRRIEKGEPFLEE
jgi:extracellular matrix regulatory protein A